LGVWRRPIDFSLPRDALERRLEVVLYVIHVCEERSLDFLDPEQVDGTDELSTPPENSAKTRTAQPRLETQELG
jgi:hypothetical protein